MRRVVWAGMALLLLASSAVVGGCGGGGGSEAPGGAPPPPAAPPSYEAPPMEQMLAMGEKTTVGGITFTVVEYVVTPTIRDDKPLESGLQFLLVHYKAENNTDAPLPPPYLDGNILVIHKGRALGVPSLIFSPTAPLPDGREVSHYSFRNRFQGELGGGAVADGWEAYYVPIDFSAADGYVRVTFGSGEQVFWSFAK